MTANGNRPKFDYARNPMLVYWEMTQACALACRHCRLDAILQCHPKELTRDESRTLLGQIAEFGDPLPHLVLTGGDPLQRRDLYEVITEARRLGMQVSVTPSATEALTREVLEKLKAHDIHSIALSLDGPTAAKHEAVRGVPGCFARTLAAAQNARESGLPLQVNTLVTEATAEDLPAIYELLQSLGIMRWSLFFLIAVGRGKALLELSPQAGERWMHWIFDVASKAPFAVKTTEAPFYRRVALERMRGKKIPPQALQRASVYKGMGIRDGHGIMFISNQGEICPAGFLPLSAGNVRTAHVVEVYRSSPLFADLHRPERLKGKCGECEFREICGGSRARAYAYTGDPLESDPFCSYVPMRTRTAEASVIPATAK